MVARLARHVRAVSGKRAFRQSQLAFFGEQEIEQELRGTGAARPLADGRESQQDGRAVRDGASAQHRLDLREARQ